MDNRVLEAYKYLVPVDQILIDTIILALYDKDRQISDMAREILKSVSDDSNG